MDVIALCSTTRGTVQIASTSGAVKLSLEDAAGNKVLKLQDSPNNPGPPCILSGRESPASPHHFLFKGLPMKKLLMFLVAACLCAPLVSAQDKKATPEEQFKKLDTNSDGKLSKEEFVGKRKGDKAGKAEEMFKKKDKNSDGFLDLAEFGGKKAK